MVHITYTAPCTRGQLKCNDTRAETRYRLSAKRRVHLNRQGATIQSNNGSRGVRISGSNAGYTVFRDSVKEAGYPLHSPVSPSLPLPCVTVYHHTSTGFCYGIRFQDVWQYFLAPDIFHLFQNQHRYVYMRLSSPPWCGVPGPLHYRGFAFTLRHTTLVKKYSGRAISPSQRLRPDSTTITTDIHSPGGIRTRNPSKRATADPRLTLRGHRNRRTDDVIHSTRAIPSYSQYYDDNKYALLSLFTEVSA